MSSPHSAACRHCDATFHVLPATRERRLRCTRCGAEVLIPAVSHAALRGPRLYASKPRLRGREAPPREAQFVRRLVFAQAFLLTPATALLARFAGLPGLSDDESLVLTAAVPGLIAALLLVASLGLWRRLMIGWFGLFYLFATAALFHLRYSLALFSADVDTTLGLRWLLDHGLPLAGAGYALVLLWRPALREACGISLPRGGGMPSVG